MRLTAVKVIEANKNVSMFIVLISVLATCKWLLALCCLLN